MSVEDNLRLRAAGNQALNDHDLERFLSLHLESVIVRDARSPEPTKGKAAIRAGLEPMLRAFPDIRLVTERSFGSGDWIAEQGYAIGTHKGPLEAPGAPPIPATNRTVRIPYGFFGKIEGGKFAESHVYFDQMTMLTQLGLGPQGPSQKKP